MRHDRITPEPPLDDLAAARRAFAPAFAGLAREELRIAYLDARGRVLHVTATRGAADGRSVDLPLREVIATALTLDAAALLLAHNHPCGDPTPSAADKSVTRRLAEVARPLGLRLIDHLVFAGEGCASFRAMGLL
jgi:DNA repair protein RadC